MLGASQLPAPATQLPVPATQLPAMASQLPAMAYLPLPVTIQRLLTVQLVTSLGHAYNQLTAATLMVLHYNT